MYTSCKNNRKGSTSDNQGLRTKKNSINRVIAGTSLNVNFKRELSQTSASHYNNGHESKKGTSTTSHEQFYNPENGAPFLQSELFQFLFQYSINENIIENNINFILPNVKH